MLLVSERTSRLPACADYKSDAVNTLVLFTSPMSLCVAQQIDSSSNLYCHLTLPVTYNNKFILQGGFFGHIC